MSILIVPIPIIPILVMSILIMPIPVMPILIPILVMSISIIKSCCPHVHHTDPSNTVSHYADSQCTFSQCANYHYCSEIR